MNKEQDNKVHFVVGDIHGCHQQLLSLEEEIASYCKKIEKSPVIVCVGDLIDRGPDTLAVVRHVREGVQAGTHFCVAGNHEAIFIELIDFFCMGRSREWIEKCCYLQSLSSQFTASAHANTLALHDYATWRKQMWVSQGGRETLESFGLSDDSSFWDFDAFEAEIRFLAELPLVYYSPAVCVTHALADFDSVAWVMRDPASWVCTEVDGQEDPGLELIRSAAQNAVGSAEKETAETENELPSTVNDQSGGVKASPEMLRHHHVQALLWSRESHLKWPDGFPVHVSGHTPHDQVIWSPDGRRLQLDTGCVYGHSLTAWCAETGQFLTS